MAYSLQESPTSGYLLYRNLLVLDKLFPLSSDLKECINDTMFDVSNKKGFYLVAKYLVSVIYGPEGSHPFLKIRITDRKSEMNFIRSFLDILKFVSEENPQLHLHLLMASVLLTAKGEKFVNIIWKLSLYVIIKVTNDRRIGIFQIPKQGNKRKASMCVKRAGNSNMNWIANDLSEMEELRKYADSEAREMSELLLKQVREEQELHNVINKTIEKLPVKEEVKKQFRDRKINPVSYYQHLEKKMEETTKELRKIVTMGDLSKKAADLMSSLRRKEQLNVVLDGSKLNLQGSENVKRQNFVGVQTSINNSLTQIYIEIKNCNIDNVMDYVNVIKDINENQKKNLQSLDEIEKEMSSLKAKFQECSNEDDFQLNASEPLLPATPPCNLIRSNNEKLSRFSLGGYCTDVTPPEKKFAIFSKDRKIQMDNVEVHLPRIPVNTLDNIAESYLNRGTAENTNNSFHRNKNSNKEISESNVCTSGDLQLPKKNSGQLDSRIPKFRFASLLPKKEKNPQNKEKSELDNLLDECVNEMSIQDSFFEEFEEIPRRVSLDSDNVQNSPGISAFGRKIINRSNHKKRHRLSFGKTKTENETSVLNDIFFPTIDYSTDCNFELNETSASAFGNAITSSQIPTSSPISEVPFQPVQETKRRSSIHTIIESFNKIRKNMNMKDLPPS